MSHHSCNEMSRQRVACVGSEEEGEVEVEELGGPQRDEVAQTQGFRRDAGRDAAAAAKPGHARFCLREYLHRRGRCAGVRNPRQVSA